MSTSTALPAPRLSAGDLARPAEAAPSAASRDPVISVRGIGKRYDIYARNLDRLKDAFTGSNRRARPFWALKDISFDVYPGDAVGIVGRNGSGKSTLMQIIAGTLTPTEGEVHVRGRIAALLELGSGFNPQFTGRENVFLAGSILGFSRRDMEQRFDSIAAFAEIGEFLDQPVEVYSSGMHARLAFAVASSVEPEILILDEILSVGDAGFQQKCIARLRQLLDGGVTLLFVSHAPDAVKSLCNKAVFLKQGTQDCFGPSAEVVDQYMQFIREGNTQRGLIAQPAIAEAKPVAASLLPPVGAAGMSAEAPPQPASNRYGTGHGSVLSVRLLDDRGRASDAFAHGEAVTVEVAFVARIGLERVDVVLVIRDGTGIDVIGTTAWDEGARLPGLAAGERVVVRLTFTNTLKPGPHGVCITLGSRPERVGDGMITLDHLDGCAAFQALAPDRRPIRGKVQVPFKAGYEVNPPA